MRTSIIRLTSACLPALLLAGCGPEHPAPSPPPPPKVAPLVAPAPIPTDWRDRDLTPGEWRWQADSAASTASFGLVGQAPRFTLRCDLARHVVRLSWLTRGGDAAMSAAPPAPHLERQMTIKTTSATEQRLGLVDTQGASFDVVMAATDSLLDRIVHSQGRFMLEVDGGGWLILPLAGDVARAVEDCRI